MASVKGNLETNAHCAQCVNLRVCLLYAKADPPSVNYHGLRGMRVEENEHSGIKLQNSSRDCSVNAWAAPQPRQCIETERQAGLSGT